MIQEKLEIEYGSKKCKVATKVKKVGDDWIVFLHGIGCAKECFDAAFNDTLADKYSVLTFDFIGFGESDKPNDFSYTLEDHANIAGLVIAWQKPASVTVVAHSMGGTIGLLLVPKLDNLVSFINVEGGLLPDEEDTASRRSDGQTEQDFVRDGYKEFLSDLKASDDPAFRAWAVWYGTSNPLAVFRSGASLVKWLDKGELLPYFNGLPRKAFIYGDKADNAPLLTQFSGVDVFAIPDSGHFMMLDQPDLFYAAIRKHLAFD